MSGLVLRDSLKNAQLESKAEPEKRSA